MCGIILAVQKGEGDGYALNNLIAYRIIKIVKAFGEKIKLMEGKPGRLESGDSATKARDELSWNITVNIMGYSEQFIAEHPRLKLPR